LCAPFPGGDAFRWLAQRQPIPAIDSLNPRNGHGGDLDKFVPQVFGVGVTERILKDFFRSFPVFLAKNREPHGVGVFGLVAPFRVLLGSLDNDAQKRAAGVL
jgi:hypothetical protein